MHDSVESKELTWHEANMIVFENGGFDQYMFYQAFYKYDNQSIEKSLGSDNAIIKMLAIMDKRVGKRTLEKLSQHIVDQPEWLQFFYRLRIQAENIICENKVL